jgi:hypothetical protein
MSYWRYVAAIRPFLARHRLDVAQRSERLRVFDELQLRDDVRG